MLAKVINVELLKHPINWVIVPLILLFVLQLVALLTANVSQQQEN